MADKKQHRLQNSTLFGLGEKQRLEQPYQKHSLIRNNWRSSDRLKESIGFNPSINEEDGGSKVYERLRSNVVPGVEVYSPFKSAENLGPVKTQIENNSTGFSPVMDASSPDYLLFREQGWFSLGFNKNSWNDAPTSPPNLTVPGTPMRSLLLKEGEGTIFEGVPYFAKYFAQTGEDPQGLLITDARMIGATADVPPLMAGNTGTPIAAHPMEYAVYDRSTPQDPDNQYDIRIDPVYNYFLDTSTDYESVIGAETFPESLIPNYYMLEMNIATSSYPYLAETSFDSSASMKVEEIFEGVRNLTPLPQLGRSQGYLEYYTIFLSQHPDPQDLYDTYRSTYKNIAVLSDDISNGVFETYNNIIRDDRGTAETSDDFYAIENYPFYNKITIPYDQQFPGASGLVETMNIHPAVTSTVVNQFYMLAQLMIIDSYLNSSSAEQFNIYDAETLDVVVADQPASLVFHLEDLVKNLYAFPDSDVSTRANELIEAYAGASTASPPNVVFLQSDAFRNADTTLTGLQNSHTPAQLYLAVRNSIQTLTREYADIFSEVFPATWSDVYKGWSEPIMYVVEKSVLGSNEGPVQTLFFGRDQLTQKGIEYIDTQIKYGVKYQYNIKQVRLVFGNRYQYDSAVTIANSGSVHEGRALGNALGFYAEEESGVTSTLSFQSVQGMPTFTYLPEDDETSFRQQHVGYYIYKWKQESGNLVAPASVQGAIGAGVIGNTSEDAPGAPSLKRFTSYDASKISFQVNYGEGFDGNFSGGSSGGIPVYTDTDEGPLFDQELPTLPVFPERTDPYEGITNQQMIDRINDLHNLMTGYRPTATSAGGTAVHAVAADDITPEMKREQYRAGLTWLIREIIDADAAIGFNVWLWGAEVVIDDSILEYIIDQMYDYLGLQEPFVGEYWQWEGFIGSDGTLGDTVDGPMTWGLGDIENEDFNMEPPPDSPFIWLTTLLVGLNVPGVEMPAFNTGP